MTYRTERPFAPEGLCPICGSHIFTKEERKAQVKLAREIVEEIKAIKRIMSKLDNIEEEY